jgi:hypothetical protein
MKLEGRKDVFDDGSIITVYEETVEHFYSVFGSLNGDSVYQPPL